MAQVVFIDPLGFGGSLFRHRHFSRDWTGAFIPGCLPFPPLDVMFAASYLRSHGHAVQIIEASAKHWRHAKAVAAIQYDPPDFIFIPSTYFTVDDDKALSRIIRDRFPHTKIIFGGPLITHDPSLVLADGSADFAALGEFESPLLNIIEGKSKDNVAYREGGKTVLGPRSLLDLATLPPPARDLIDNQAYRYAIFNRRNPITATSMSRGCPHSKCRFCTSPLYSLGEVRYRNFDSIAEEIEEIVFKYRIGEIFFKDQTFTSNRELVFRLCEHMISKGIDIPWRVSTRVDHVDKELLQLMRRAGCYQISFGFESCSQSSLDSIDKRITIEQSRQAAQWTKEAGIEMVGLFMVGMPADTRESMSQLVSFALELGVDYAQFNKIFLTSGSYLYDKVKERQIEILPSSIIMKYVLLSYFKFYFRPRWLAAQFSRIKSCEDFKFLIKASFEEFLSLF